MVISGTGISTFDGKEINIKAGDVITMKAGIPHMVASTTILKLIEVQLGSEISVTDKIKEQIRQQPDSS